MSEGNLLAGFLLAFLARPSCCAYFDLMKSLRKNLKPSWTFASDKKVWRLLPGNGVLAVELRDTEAKTAEYAGIAISSGSPLWQGVSLEDSWWIVMNRIFKDVLLLQQFVRPDMPTPGGIFAIDLFTGKMLWQNQDLTFVDASNDMVYASRKSVSDEEIIGLDYRTGDQKLVLGADDQQAAALSFDPPRDEFMLSSFFEEVAGTLPRSRRELLGKATPAGALNPTYILSVFGKDIIGFYTDSGKDEKGVPVFDSHLRIIDPEGKPVFDDVIDRKVYTTLGDFYFVVENRLVYAKNSVEVVAVNLQS